MSECGALAGTYRCTLPQGHDGDHGCTWTIRGNDNRPRWEYRARWSSSFGHVRTWRRQVGR